jgi:hypothetical protein
MKDVKINRDDIVYYIFPTSAAISYRGKTVCFSKDDARFLELLHALETGGSLDFLSGVAATNEIKELFGLIGD